MLRAARALRGRWGWAACSRKKNAVDGLQPPADSVFRPRRSRLSSAQGWKCAVTTLDTEIDTVLLDCDGVLWNGDTVIDGAREALASFRAAGKRLLFITNNSTKSREMAAEKFRKLEIEGVEAEDIITSGYSAAQYLVAHEWRTPARFSAMVVGSAGITDELALASVHAVTPEPESEHAPGSISTTVDAATFASWDLDPQIGAVVVGMDTSLNYRRLARDALALQDPECLFVATNMDAADNVGGAERLRLMPGAGAAVGALRGCTGREPVNCGKGGAWILQMMRQEFSLVPHKTLMVGDRLDTDIAFGLAAGMRTALPLTGVTTAQMLADLPAGAMRPDFVLPSIASITLRADA